MRNREDYRVIKENFLGNNKIIPRCYEIMSLLDLNTIRISINDDEDKSKKIYLESGLVGRWCYEDNKYILFLQVNISGSKEEYNKIKENNKIVRKNIPIIINSIIKADKDFFKENYKLKDAEIFIKFNCKHDDFFKVENWGRVEKYINIKNRSINKEDYEGKINILKERIKDDNDIIINLLNPYVELYLSPIYGINIKYLIKNINIISKDKIEDILSEENKKHEIVLSVKVMLNNILEEVILSAVITKRRVIIKLIA